MLQPNFTIKALKPNAPLLNKTTLYFMLTLQVPEATPNLVKKRSRLNLSLVIDRSGSMSGNPLREAKECAKRVAKSMNEGDILSIISYDDNSRVVFPAKPVDNIQSVLNAIDTISDGGSTNLHAGWIAGIEQVAANLAPDVISRVIVLSDGKANRGIVDTSAIATQATAFAAKGISTSTVGLGRSFNEDLMTSLANSGLGECNYGESAEDLWPTFAAEFGLLAATAGKNVRLKLSSPFQIEMKTDYQKSTSGEWLLNNLVYAAEINALVCVHIGECTGASIEPLQASVSYQTTDGVQAVELKTSLTLPLVSLADFTLAQSDTAVQEQIRLIDAAELQRKARVAAEQRDFNRVTELADQMMGLSGDNQWIKGMATNMKGLARDQDAVMLGKEAAYSATKLTRSYNSTTGDESSFFAKRVRQGIQR